MTASGAYAPRGRRLRGRSPGSSARNPRLRALPFLRNYGSGRRVLLRLHAARLGSAFLLATVIAFILEVLFLLAAERLWVTELRNDERSLESLFLELTSDPDAVGERDEVAR